MPKLPKPPKTVPVDNDITKLAPKFQVQVLKILEYMKAKGFDPYVFEALRTDERQAFLYGFGREYDDGRGEVTKAATADKSWHKYGLAVDIVSKSKMWDAPEAFWKCLGEACKKFDVRWGDDWDRDGIRVGEDPDEKLSDRPHIQWNNMRVGPSDEAVRIVKEKGLEGLWKVLKAA